MHLHIWVRSVKASVCAGTLSPGVELRGVVCRGCSLLGRELLLVDVCLLIKSKFPLPPNDHLQGLRTWYLSCCIRASLHGGSGMFCFVLFCFVCLATLCALQLSTAEAAFPPSNLGWSGATVCSASIVRTPARSARTRTPHIPA